MRHDDLFLWLLTDPAAPRYVGQLRLVDAGKGVSLQYGAHWLASGFPLSEDLVLVDIEQLPRWKNMAVGAVDDARPDRWGERVIQYIDKPARLSIMEYLFYAGDDRFGGAKPKALKTAPRASIASRTVPPCARRPSQGRNQSLATRALHSCYGASAWRKMTSTYATCRSCFAAWCSTS